jgi:hypothetical protein
MRKFLKRIIDILDGVPAARPDRSRGQSLVEMTVITPLLLIMFVGMVEIGWFAQNYLNLVEAAKVGARRAPFLNGVYSPQQWNEAASQPPIPELGFSLAPGDVGYNEDPRVTYRGIAGIGPQTCESILPDEYGFFNTIACTVVDAMDPLRIKLGNRKDDIVVSGFSIQRVKIGPPGANDNDIDPAAKGSVTPYENGSQVIVVGRWPATANECYLWGERDPFDWITDADVNWENVENPAGAQYPDIRINYELGVWDELAGGTGDYIGWLDSGIEKVVGFSWTGQRQIEDANRERIDCWGSQWTMGRVQQLVNLPRFIPEGSPDEEDRKQYFPSLGLAIVEIYWEHTLLLESFPLLSSRWSPIYQAMGGDDPDSTADVVFAWAAFPAPSAEPRLVFKP